MRVMVLVISVVFAAVCRAQEAAPEAQAKDVTASVVRVHIERSSGGQSTAIGFVGPEGLVYTAARPLIGATKVEIETAGGERVGTRGLAGYEHISEAAALGVEWGERRPPSLEWATVDTAKAKSIVTRMGEDAASVPVQRSEHSMWCWHIEAGVERASRIRSGNFGSPLVDEGGRVMGMVIGPAAPPPGGEGQQGNAKLVWIAAVRAEVLAALPREDSIPWDEWREEYTRAGRAWSVARQAHEAGHEDDYVAALEHAQEAVEIDPRCWGGWQWIATVRYHQQEYDESLEAIERLLKILPTDYWGLPTKAILLASHEMDLDGAEQVARKAVKLLPTQSMAWYALGFVQQYQGEGEDAIESYRRALKLDPSNSHAEAELMRLDGEGEEAKDPF